MVYKEQNHRPGQNMKTIVNLKTPWADVYFCLNPQGSGLFFSSKYRLARLRG